MGDFDFTDLLSIYGLYSSKKTAEANSAQAAAVAQQNLAFSQEQVDFMKEQYANWQGVYGDLQNNLSSFYTNLSSMENYFEVTDLQNIQQQFQKVSQDLQVQFTQRGLENSGIMAKAQTTLAADLARARTKAIADAPFKAAEQGSNFLQKGLSSGLAAGNGGTSNTGGVKISDIVKDTISNATPDEF